MRDAYILDLAASAGAPADPPARLDAASAALSAAQERVFGTGRPLSLLAVASADGPRARSLGLLAGYSAELSGQDVGAGSGLTALAAAARAVTSGFESVAAGVAFGASVPEPEWPAALHQRFTPVSLEQAEAYALERAGVTADEVRDGIDARRAAWIERGGERPVTLATRGGLPVGPDSAGLGVVVLAGHTEIREHGWPTRARVTSVVQVGVDPALGPAAAAHAAEVALHRLQLRADELDRVQVDARSPVAPAVVAKALGIGADRLNVAPDAFCVGSAGAASGLFALEAMIADLEAADRRFGLVVGLEPMGGAIAVVVDRQFYL